MKTRYPIHPNIKTTLDKAEYERLYHWSISDPDSFWAEQAKALHWHKPWETLRQEDFHTPTINWFEGGQLNIAYNCLDRHLPARAAQTAIIWEGDEPGNIRHISYADLHRMVCQTANALEALGVKAGDRVTIYMPMVPEAAVAMLACARIGAIHSVVFGGFSAQALRSRMEDAASHFLITADEARRGGKTIPLKTYADQAMEGLDITHALVLKHTGAETTMQTGRDIWWHEAVNTQSPTHTAQAFDAEHPLFMLYTSGSTGKPKGVVHSSAGYLLYAALTHKTVFNITEGDVYWCTADVGWITGHSYVVYGPLANGTTTVMFEGVPHYPAPDRFWQLVDTHRINVLYTAPTAIRALMREGDHWLKSSSRHSLRLLGSVGEPINPEAWRWYYDVVGKRHCPIMDTWWQTETGGILITPLPGATELKPGSATLPFFGVQPALIDSHGQEIMGEGEGALCLKTSWPGQARTVYGDHDRFRSTYFTTYPGYYFSGDGARRDADGYYWITGRMDDVLNISGHRLGTAEIESALVAHPDVTEAAVVGMPHPIKGEAICAYVTLLPESTGDTAALKQWVRESIGAIATPDQLIFAEALPKTRSGKIMRRILRKIAAGETSDLGDTSTLLNPEAVEDLIQKMQKD